MNRYREEVARVLATHHARLELGLCKSREQEPFVCQMSERLKRNKIAHSIVLTRDFDVIFRLPEYLFKADNLLQTIFSGCLIERDEAAWIISDLVNEYAQIRLVKENEDGF